MTREKFVAQLDEGEIEALQALDFDEGEEIEPAYLDVELEMAARFLHHGLVATIQRGDWIFLTLTETGRGAMIALAEIVDFLDELDVAVGLRPRMRANREKPARSLGGVESWPPPRYPRDSIAKKKSRSTAKKVRS